MRTPHFVTLPTSQAEWFAEICAVCGIFTRLFRADEVRTQIMTVCEEKDRVAVWNLFIEAFNEKICKS